MLKKLIQISLLCFLLSSCGSKTASEYGEEYCNCMKENNDNLIRCKSIIEDAKSEFDENDETARKEFFEAYNNCMAD